MVYYGPIRRGQLHSEGIEGITIRGPREYLLDKRGATKSFRTRGWATARGIPAENRKLETRDGELEMGRGGVRFLAWISRVPEVLDSAGILRLDSFIVGLEREFFTMIRFIWDNLYAVGCEWMVWISHRRRCQMLVAGVRLGLGEVVIEAVHSAETARRQVPGETQVQYGSRS